MAVVVCVLSHVWLFETSWTMAHQAPLSVEFSRQEYWSGLPFLSPGDLSEPRIKPLLLASPELVGGFFTTPPGKSFNFLGFLISQCIFVHHVGKEIPWKRSEKGMSFSILHQASLFTLTHLFLCLPNIICLWVLDNKPGLVHLYCWIMLNESGAGGSFMVELKVIMSLKNSCLQL